MPWYWYKLVELGLVYAKDVKEAKVMALLDDDLHPIAKEVPWVEEFDVTEEEQPA